MGAALVPLLASIIIRYTLFRAVSASAAVYLQHPRKQDSCLMYASG
jgi:hypothetical protein